MTNSSHPQALALEAGTHALCTCGLSKNSAFCDGSHTRLTNPAAAGTRQRPWWQFWN